MPELLFNDISKKGVELNPDEAAIVKSAFHFRKFRKKQYLLQQGDVSRYETFILKGLTRTYLVDETGVEHVISFGAENWWAGDLFSFFTRQTTSYNIDCLENTEVLQITKDDLDRIFTEVPKMNIYFRILYSSSIIAFNNRVASSLCKTALERYNEFNVRYPQLQQRLPNHQIASYLGITPQSLSRLRKQI